MEMKKIFMQQDLVDNNNVSKLNIEIQDLIQYNGNDNQSSNKNKIRYKKRNTQNIISLSKRHKASLEVQQTQKIYQNDDLISLQEQIFRFDQQSQKFDNQEDLDQQISSQELFSMKNLDNDILNQQVIFDKDQQIKSIFKTQISLNQPKNIVKDDDKLSSRRKKVQKYLLKRSHRSFNRKPSYHCRKIVAQSRLRIKGKFISRTMAQTILEIDVSMLSNNEIKSLLLKHFQE